MLRKTAVILNTMAIMNMSTITYPSIRRWHEHLGHLHFATIRQLGTITEGMHIAKKEDTTAICKPCLEGKQHVTYNKTPSTRVTQHLELIHSDLCGPFSRSSIAGNLYFIIYIDDYSRMTWIHFLRSKT